MQKTLIIIAMSLLMCTAAFARKKPRKHDFSLDTSAGVYQGQRCAYEYEKPKKNKPDQEKPKREARCGYGRTAIKFPDPYVTCQAVTPGKNLIGTYLNPAYRGNSMPGAQSEYCTVWELPPQ